MKTFKKKDKHPLAINILKLQRYNFDFFSCEEVVFFEYIMVKGMAFKKQREFYHSSETIRKETGIKKNSLNTIINKFIELGIISIEVKGMPRVKYFTIHYPKIVELLPEIYKLSEKGKLYNDFSKHLSDFFIPLVDNYQEKNSIKNNKEEINKKEKKEIESDSDTIISFFNDCLSDLKYNNKISDAYLKYNEIDLFRALKTYEIEVICKYVNTYFEDNWNKRLTTFFKFDKIAVNRLIFIEEKIADEIEFVNNFIENLQGIYSSRIKIYNENENYDRAKSITKLVVTKKIKEQIAITLKSRSELEINHAFIAYVDDVLKGNTGVNKLLPYFFSKKDDEYQIINNYLEYFNMEYGHSK